MNTLIRKKLNLIKEKFHFMILLKSTYTVKTKAAIEHVLFLLLYYVLK